jgi:hypothetical protein
LPRAQYVACRRVPRSHKSGQTISCWSSATTESVRLAMSGARIRAWAWSFVLREAPCGCGCDGIVLPPARRIRGWQISGA